MWLCSQRGLFLGLLCFGLVGFLLFDHHASDDNRWASATPSFNLAKLQAGGSEFAQQQCKAYMESESYYRDGNHLQWDRLGVEKHALAMNTTHVHGRPPVFHYIVSNDPKRDGPFKPRMLMFYSVLSTYFVGKSMCTFVHITAGSEPQGPVWKVIKPWVVVRHSTYPKRIGKVSLSDLKWVQHRSDYYRMTLLTREGGTYLDNDVIVQSGLVASMGAGATIMIEEPIRNPISDYHVVSAFIQSEVGHPFLKAWLSTYKSDYQFWNWGYNSAIIPWSLSGRDQFRHDVFVLPQMLQACFLSSDKGDLKEVCKRLLTDNFPEERRHALVVHFSMTKDLLDNISKKTLREKHRQSTVFKLIEPFLTHVPNSFSI